MQTACMNKNIHIRDFDSELHAALVKNAERKKLSLSQYLRDELAKIARAPTAEVFGEMLVNLPREGHVSEWSSQRTVRIIHEGREQRTEQISNALSFDSKKPAA